MQNDLYSFPYVRVCMWQHYGCSYEDASECAFTAIENTTLVEYDDQVFYGVQNEVSGIAFRNQHVCVH